MSNEAIGEVSFPADDDDDGDDDIPAISWKDLAQNRWFLIEGKKDVQTKWGLTKLLNLKDGDGERLTVWATSLITNTLDEKWEMKANVKLFIKSLGEKKCKNGPFSYFNYKYKTVK